LTQKKKCVENKEELKELEEEEKGKTKAGCRATGIGVHVDLKMG
jgi:hypothetical protein